MVKEMSSVHDETILDDFGAFTGTLDGVHSKNEGYMVNGVMRDFISIWEEINRK